MKKKPHVRRKRRGKRRNVKRPNKPKRRRPKKKSQKLPRPPLQCLQLPLLLWQQNLSPRLHRSRRKRWLVLLSSPPVKRSHHSSEQDPQTNQSLALKAARSPKRTTRKSWSHPLCRLVRTRRTLSNSKFPAKIFPRLPPPHRLRLLLLNKGVPQRNAKQKPLEAAETSVQERCRMVLVSRNRGPSLVLGALSHPNPLQLLARAMQLQYPEPGLQQ